MLFWELQPGGFKVLNPVRVRANSVIVSSCGSGSIPEEEDGRLYNTCAVFGPDGEMILKHRKVTARQRWRNSSLKWMDDTPSFSQIHLFDIDVPGKIRFQESETLSPGDSLSVFQTRKRRLLSLTWPLMAGGAVVTLLLCPSPRSLL